MAYCTSTDIANRLGADAALRAFDRDGDGTADTAAYTTAIAWADALIDARLAGAYPTPFTGTIAVLVRELSIDLAVYRVVSGYTGATGATQAPYRQSYADALALLKDLKRDRDARLPSGAAEPIASAASYIDDAAAPATPWTDAADPAGGFSGF